METYQVVAEYLAEIEHRQTSEMHSVKARVLEGPSKDHFHIEYSHTCKPNGNSIGMWYSNSYTHAYSMEDAEITAKGWFEVLANSHEIGVWNPDL